MNSTATAPPAAARPADDLERVPPGATVFTSLPGGCWVRLVARCSCGRHYHIWYEPQFTTAPLKHHPHSQEAVPCM